MKPVRIQRKRTKGWRLPPNTEYVGRPTKWGNPFKPSPEERCEHCHSILQEEFTAEDTVAYYKLWVTKKLRLSDEEFPHNITELKGKNLACWCKPSDPCHADVLLELANAE